MIFFIFLLGAFASTIDKQQVSVTLDKHQHIRIETLDPTLVATVEKLVVCSNENKNVETHIARINEKKGCATPGFIQYNLPHTYSRVNHPHIERVTPDHYYAEVHLKIHDRKTGETTDDVCMLRVDILRADTQSILFACLALTVIGAVALGVVLKKRRYKKTLSKVEQEKLIVENMDLYSMIEL